MQGSYIHASPKKSCLAQAGLEPIHVHVCMYVLAHLSPPQLDIGHICSESTLPSLWQRLLAASDEKAGERGREREREREGGGGRGKGEKTNITHVNVHT